jgi:hypothetical protein
MVKFKLWMAPSTCSFASTNGKDKPGLLRKDTKTNRSTLASLAARTSVNCPSASTVCIESPGWRVSVDEAVEMTAFTPRHAATIDCGSFRSPMHSSAPADRNFSILSGELVGRTSALTRSPRLLSRWQTSFPTKPVAPTTRTISILPKTDANTPVAAARF